MDLNEVCDVEFKVNHAAFNGSFLFLQGTKLATIDTYKNFVEYGVNVNAKKIISADGQVVMLI